MTPRARLFRTNARLQNEILELERMLHGADEDPAPRVEVRTTGSAMWLPHLSRFQPPLTHTRKLSASRYFCLPPRLSLLADRPGHLCTSDMPLLVPACPSTLLCSRSPARRFARSAPLLPCAAPQSQPWLI